VIIVIPFMEINIINIFDCVTAIIFVIAASISLTALLIDQLSLNQNNLNLVFIQPIGYIAKFISPGMKINFFAKIEFVIVFLGTLLEDVNSCRMLVFINKSLQNKWILFSRKILDGKFIIGVEKIGILQESISKVDLQSGIDMVAKLIQQIDNAISLIVNHEKYSYLKLCIGKAENVNSSLFFSASKAQNHQKVNDIKENPYQMIRKLRREANYLMGGDAIRENTGEENSSKGEENFLSRGFFKEDSINESLLYQRLQELTYLSNELLTDFPALLEAVVSYCCRIFDKVQFAAIFLENQQNNQLEIAASFGVEAEKIPLLKLTDFIREIFTTGIPQSLSSPFVYGIPLSLPSSLMAKQGVLVIGNWKMEDAFDISQRKLINSIGEVVGNAIYHAKRIKAISDREEELARQNQILIEQNRELEKNRHQIQIQNLQLLEAAQLKSQFLATTSHELHTPLNVILGLSQVLLRQRNSYLSEQQMDMVKRILNNGNHLLSMIDDMLFFAKNQSGCLSFQENEFHLPNLLSHVVEEYHSFADEEGLTLQLHVKLDNPIVINDSIRLKQVLSKLLLNAIKFTEKGSIEIKAWENEKGKIIIAIKDTGIGIPSSDLENIFEQFWQVDSTITRKYGGAGLGLAITKSLVEIMQGNIYVHSQLGKGSTFIVEFPREVSFQEWNQEWNNDCRNSGFSKKVIF
jgi:signal transduction histidine kinase